MGQTHGSITSLGVSSISNRTGSKTDAAGELLNVLHVDVSVMGIPDPSYRMFDVARGMWHSMIQQPIKLYPYVEIILGKTRVLTDYRRSITNGEASFGRSCLCLMLPASDYLFRGGSTRRKKMTLRVFNKRWGPSLRGDPLIGEADLHLDMSRLVGQEHNVCVPISRHGHQQGQILVKYSVRPAEDSAYDLLHETAQHSVSEVAAALAQVLQGKNGLQIARAALPRELVPPQESLGQPDPLQDLLVSLCNQVSMLADESDQEVLERFGRLSRSVQDFVAKYASSDADVISLAKLWIRKIFKDCVSKQHSSFLPQLDSLDEDRLHKFIEAGTRFPGIKDLVPIDRYGNEVKDWRRLSDLPKEAILGEGAYGFVWRAKDTRTNEWFAVKNSRRTRSRFVQREIAVTDHVLMRPHPCIVQIFGTHYMEDVQKSSLIMEFCTGGDLLREIQRWVQDNPSGFTPPPVAPFYLAQVLTGIEHLHTKLVTLLRDLKPENVVLTIFSGRHIRAKLTDFGLSRIGAESTGAWTLQPAPPGTAHYVAPEVVLRKKYGQQADIYSLGVLTWNVLTGGLVHRPGIPPCVRVAHNQDFEAYADNWKLIKRCVRDPYSNGARPMPCSASEDFVLKLTRENPQARLDYAAIRSHAYVHQMNLPPADAKSDVVESWLEQYEAALASQAPGDVSRFVASQGVGASSGTSDADTGIDDLQLGLPVVVEESANTAQTSKAAGDSEVLTIANETAVENFPMRAG